MFEELITAATYKKVQILETTSYTFSEPLL